MANSELNELEEKIKNDPSASFWLKKQIQETKDRDPVDALSDIEVLSFVLRLRLDGLMTKGS